jgi:hypothetical protein
MDDMIEISEINLDNDLGGWEPKKTKTTNFGGGLELLMNDKVKDRPSSGNIELDDLNNLENELNELTNNTPDTFKPKSDLFGDKPTVTFSDSPTIGRSTAADSEGDTKTWDGYGKFNNIPINIDNPSSSPQMGKEELLKEKFKILRKLEALEKKGVELTKKYSMESSLTEMQGEYETIMDEKAKQNSIKFQGNMLMAAINGIEFLNGKFDPFDIKLDGWNEQINENISDYDEIFGELHEKYKTKASMAPELKLLFQLGGSAMMVHMTNTMFKSAMPGMDDILRQNPDLMRSFQNAAVNSMAQSNPGFSGFMSNMMNNEPQVPQGRGPPPPMATQTMPAPMGRPGNNNSMGRSNFVDDGISMRENARESMREREQPEKSRRNEMKGPSDISDIISGLKTKTINIQDKQQQQFETGSTISIEDLKDMQGSGNMPKKSGRRKKSENNTVSLDI